jgi:signal transduction histidine kinase/CheY-like chemotaxis protein
MTTSDVRSFERELRLSPGPFAWALLIPAVILSFLLWDIPKASAIENVILICYAGGLLVLVASSLGVLLGRIMAIAVYVVVVLSAVYWLQIPGLVYLLVVPIALAAVTLGELASLITAVLLIALLPTVRFPLLLSAPLLFTALALFAVMAGIIILLRRSARQLAHWAWQHYEQARVLLDEARNRQAELADTLDALAHANRELALTGERLAALRVIAEQAQKAKAAFVANVSHEFRTPLNIIIGLAEILTDTEAVYGEVTPPNVKRDLAILYRNCEHLAAMVNDVLDLSQVEAGRLALHRAYVDPMAMIESALTVVRPLCDNRHLSLRVEAPDEVPQVYCDPARIRQVVLNLISNAARFTQAGGITVRVAVTSGYLVVCVHDTGPGIAAEDIKRIFEPFWQAPSQPGQRPSGSGLGLSISQQFVKLHEGEMWVESESGQGSSFYFRLPLSPLSGPVMVPHGWITEGWVQRTSRADVPVAHLDERVIVCDQAGDLAGLLSRYDDHVEFVGARDVDGVEVALDEAGALAVILNAEPRALWGLVDQARQRIPDTPIIGCSVSQPEGLALARGASGSMTKPITKGEIVSALKVARSAVRRVLVIDDDEDTLWVMSRMLTAINPELDILTAQTGAEGLALMRSGEPDVVFLDIVLPDISGWEVLNECRADPRLAELPIVILSAQDMLQTPISSPLVMATMGRGLSISRLLRCSRVLSALLLRPDQAPDPEPL